MKGELVSVDVWRVVRERRSCIRILRGERVGEEGI